MIKQKCLVGIDYGLSNTDIVVRQPNGELSYFTHQRPANISIMQIDVTLGLIHLTVQQLGGLAVTGGHHQLLPDRVENLDIVKVPELQAVGIGGLHLSGLTDALVVSAGSGTAMMSARLRGKKVQHVTGTAVGGGTLLGLARLLLSTADHELVDSLALAGNPNQVDLTLMEATGGRIGKLPADANAVNFGKIARLPDQAAWPSREDIAAGLVRMIGQVIAVLAINAARAEKLDNIVVVGHLVDLSSVRAVLQTVAGYYDVKITVPDHPGYGTALGALRWLMADA